MLSAVAFIALAEPFTQKIPDTLVEFEMRPVAGGTVSLGDQKVEVKPFYMAKTETTWDMFDAFLLSGKPSPKYDQTEFAPDAISRPSRAYNLSDLGWGHEGYPVINVSSLNVTMFCRWLSKETGRTYRLPTEAEWQLAAQAEMGGDADAIAWHAGNADGTTHPVGKKAPNAHGLHDLFGNVGEWATRGEGFVLCGPTLDDSAGDVKRGVRRLYDISWQENDPQLPKSRWWLSNGHFAGFRLVTSSK